MSNLSLSSSPERGSNPPKRPAAFKSSPLSVLFSSSLLGAGVAAFVLLSNSAAQALTWKWSAVFDDGTRAEGLFDTGPGLPSTGVTYTITGISGNLITSTTTYTIDGLSTLLGATNQFQWSGPGSNILSDIAGISFTTVDGWTAGPLVNLFSTDYSSSDPNLLFPLTNWLYESGSNGIVTASSLNPDVPGPLPILGASASFAWSRRLRRRIVRVRSEAARTDE